MLLMLWKLVGGSLGWDLYRKIFIVEFNVNCYDK
jgi:hypothetical protein